MDIVPESILKECIRPVLNIRNTYNSIGEYKILYRLIKLLSPIFNKHLWENLQQNLKKIIQIVNDNKNCEDGTKPAEFKIATYIISAFHLIHNHHELDHSFFTSLIGNVIDLQKLIPAFGEYSYLSSPFIPALAKFMNRFSTKTFEWFKLNYTKKAHLTLFISILVYFIFIIYSNFAFTFIYSHGIIFIRN